MLELRLPRVSDEAELRAARGELDAEGHDGFLLNGFSENPNDFGGWLNRVLDHAEGLNLEPGHVPATFLIAQVGDQIVGRISIRHELNDFLLNFGGHIGYMVRPGFRRKGHASQMLSQALSLTKDWGLNRVLLTCYDDNVGSIKVIESHGGILENRVDYEGKVLRRYWIEIS